MKHQISPRTVLLIVVAAAIVAALVIHITHHSTPPTSTTPPTSLPTSSTTATTPSSTTTVAPAKPSETLPSQAGFPAYQHLPYSANGITVSLTNVAPDGQFDLDVYSPTLTIAQERVAYGNFLRSYNDPGTKYIATFSSSASISPPVS